MKLTDKRFIFQGTEDIPSCHASTLLKLDEESFIFAWFSGEQEGKRDVSIRYRTMKKGVLGEIKTIPRLFDMPHWNPVLFKTSDGDVRLYYKIGENCSIWKTMIAEGFDGEEFSYPKEFVIGDVGGRGPVRNKPIYTSSGKLLCPASTEIGKWRCFIDAEDSDGVLQKHHIPHSKDAGLIQPTLWEDDEKVIHALMRSDKGRIYESHSFDDGESWSEAIPTEMPNNNSGIDLTRLDDGRIFLVCNPVGENWGKRSPISLFVSYDNGKSFEKCLDLETMDGEFSYPAIISEGKRLFITYTHLRTGIVFEEIEAD